MGSSSKNELMQYQKFLHVGAIFKYTGSPTRVKINKIENNKIWWEGIDSGKIDGHGWGEMPVNNFLRIFIPEGDVDQDERRTA